MRLFVREIFGVMIEHDKCEKCGELCITRDNPILGPLEGRYEWLCRNCARMEEMYGRLQWKPGKDPR